MRTVDASFSDYVRAVCTWKSGVQETWVPWEMASRNASYSAPCFAQQLAHALRQSTEVCMVLTPSLREGGLRTLSERPCAQVQGRRGVAPVNLVHSDT